MDFSLEYTEEQDAFAVEVREWLDENVPKGLKPVRDTLKMNDEQWQLRRDFTKKLGQKGWLYPSYPKEYGGGELSGDEVFVLYNELAERELALPPLYDMGILVSPAILVVGTEEQKKRFLPPIFTGEVLTWQLFTEPEAGTDVANQLTKALRSKREGDHFIINGHKIFVGSYPSRPEQLYVLTRSDLDAPRHHNLSSFLIPADLPGISIQAFDLFPLSTFSSQTGVTGANIEAVKHAVYFDDVKVHESRLIGKEGEGWGVTTATLEVEHGGAGDHRGGRGQGGPIGRNHMSEKFLAQCKTDPKVKRRLKENPLLLNSVLEIYIGTQIERLWTMRNINGMGGTYGGPQLSLFSKMFGTRFVKHMAKVLGPVVYTSDSEWGLENGHFETGQRCGICLAPGGTPESYKINISRALSMGRQGVTDNRNRRYRMRLDMRISDFDEILMNSGLEFLQREAPKLVIQELLDTDKGCTDTIWEKIAKLGWLGIIIPEQYGGMGYSMESAGVLFEALGTGPLPGPQFSSAILGALVVLAAGDNAQKKTILPKISSGDITLILALTEPDYSWQPNAIQTTAKGKNGDMIINGTKLHVLDAAAATHFIVAVKTGEHENPAMSVSLFLVDRQTKGLSIRRLPGFLSGRAFEVKLDNVIVSQSDMLGEKDAGWQPLEDAIMKAIPVLCAYKVGGCKAVLEMALEYSRDRVQFGRPIGRFQRVQDMLIEIVNQSDAARWTTYEALWKIDTQRDAYESIHLAKIVASEAYFQVCTLGHQVFSGISYSMEHALSLHTRTSRHLYNYLGDPTYHRQKLIKYVLS